MGYGNNNGPRKIKIPSQKYTSCSGCKFHDQQLVRSGRDPIYKHDCTHPDSGHKKGFKLSFIGNLEENEVGIVVTPDWCPILKPKQNEEGKATS